MDLLAAALSVEGRANEDRFPFSSRFYRKTKLVGFQDMECVPCGDPPPPYEPHCEWTPKAVRNLSAISRRGTVSLCAGARHVHSFIKVPARSEGLWLCAPVSQLCPLTWLPERNTDMLLPRLSFRLLSFILDTELRQLQLTRWSKP